MTIDSQTTAETMLGNGSNRKFPFTFRAWLGEIRVVLTAPDDTITDVTALSTIELETVGGIVTYPKATGSPALPVGMKITILRNMNFLQTLRLVNATRYDPVVIEKVLDRLVATDQQLREKLDRAVTFVEAALDTPQELLEEIFNARGTSVNAASSAAVSATDAANSAATAATSATQSAASATAAAASVTDAAGEAARAEDEADRAEQAALTLPPLSTAAEGDVIQARLVGGTMQNVYAQPASPATKRQDTVLVSSMANGVSFSVPAYIVGSNKLTIYLDGVLCDSGASGLYLEQGTIGNTSTTIKTNDVLLAGRELTAIVAG